MSDKVIPERHRIQYECMAGGGFTTPSLEYVKRIIEELGAAEAALSEANRERDEAVIHSRLLGHEDRDGEVAQLQATIRTLRDTVEDISLIPSSIDYDTDIERLISIRVKCDAVLAELHEAKSCS